MEFMENFEEAKKKDQLRSKILKYILYKKRTEREIRQKFKDENEQDVEEAIEYLKELHYIDDWNYIERSVLEFVNLKSLSLKEIRFKLEQKGIDRRTLDCYIEKNEDELLEYEIESAQKIWNKKIKNTDKQKVEQFLYQKGYRQETVKAISQKEK